LAPADTGESHQVRVTEAFADLGGPRECCVCRRIVTLVEILERARDEAITLLDTIAPAVVEKPLGPDQPAAGPGRLA